MLSHLFDDFNITLLQDIFFYFGALMNPLFSENDCRLGLSDDANGIFFSQQIMYVFLYLPATDT